MTPAELKKIIPFMEALTEGKRVERKTIGDGAWVPVNLTDVFNYPDDEFRIVEPPKPLECWVNVYETAICAHPSSEIAQKEVGKFVKRTAVHMVEAKEGE